MIFVVINLVVVEYEMVEVEMIVVVPIDPPRFDVKMLLLFVNVLFVFKLFTITLFNVEVPLEIKSFVIIEFVATRFDPVALLKKRFSKNPVIELMMFEKRFDVVAFPIDMFVDEEFKI